MEGRLYLCRVLTLCEATGPWLLLEDDGIFKLLYDLLRKCTGALDNVKVSRLYGKTSNVKTKDVKRGIKSLFLTTV